MSATATTYHRDARRWWSAAIRDDGRVRVELHSRVTGQRTGRAWVSSGPVVMTERGLESMIRDPFFSPERRGWREVDGGEVVQ